MNSNDDPTTPEGAPQDGRAPDSDVELPHNEPTDRSIPIMAIVGAAIAIVVAVVALVLVLDDDDTVETVDSTTTTSTSSTTPVDTSSSTEAPTTTETTAESTTTTESAASTSTTTPADPSAYRTAVWPSLDATTGPEAARFDDPVEAATAFATDFVGFTDPTVGDFQAGDSRSGEVEVRNSSDSPITTVFVRQLGSDDTWWILGAVTADIVIDRPAGLEVLDNELVVAGKARTFEGNVEVVLRADGLADPVLEGNVTGRGDGEFGDFDETFPFDPVSAENGSALFIARSAEDGSVWQASVVRVYFQN